ncbi:YybH family protein [Flagellimonas eckloniae]|uniref:DUF4440 domain-containing protein n=1 Tax=Flagellimonas eckloniae TaxID=346185 RepID=A0A0Q1H5I3_9FLAO|nr:DUF4440 domain-containing protein [Allomuricauda eckloniae]KQC28812.1 hypothetical protein AAY42_02065 [Allomuricauda eckloniae]
MKTLSFLFLALLIGCKKPEANSDIEKWKTEIMSVEKSFNDMAQNDGLAKAFSYFAAEDGVIKRGKNIIKGKTTIGKWYEKDVRPNESLSWTPTFVDVSKNGDMAYTYGNYIFTYLDSLGIKKENKGIFHTVWKRQKDGTWKFVYD